ncbi:ATP-dependent DNA ligase [Rhizoclosmatium globosum]|uniref:DNA ligase n=1 Tax=Rhizoclosmatium globosum TaxID=329046 RepID=A0A1Y2CL93_9FUNG|nr:ATP-dependent DNA ligase [Rhizoclosmatium globosum]|eukprot:ORY47727.1 ATP-dependent DNA ligase [Rhizoclosmatium globosum]
MDASDSSAQWKKGDSVPYSALCKTFDEIEATTKRLKITELLTKFFRQVLLLSPSSMLHCVYLCLNKICPEYEGKELGIGESILMKAVANATGRSIANIKTDCAQIGDLGSVAEASKKKQMTFGSGKVLSVEKVFATLKEISGITGASSQAKKIDKINSLLVNCKGSETKFLIRSLEGKLRIGLAEKTVLIAIAHAAILSNAAEVKTWSKDKLEKELENGSAIIKQVYCELPNYDLIIPALAQHGIKALHDHCKLTPGIPLKPMLAHPTKSLTEVLNRFENIEFTCEYKYDGERAQIHRLEDGTTTIYSRNSENLSAKYPDIMALIPDVVAPGVTSFVLDCEAVAWDIKKKCILPFQVLSTRKRKDVAIEDIQVSVCLYAFDILYLNGKPLITDTLRARRQNLRDSFLEKEGKFCFAKSVEANSVDEIQTFLDESVAGNCEGLMVKTLDEGSSYEPSVRSRNWLKVKKDYLNGIGDSLDLVVIGGYIGKGKRTGWYGGFLLACYDDDSETYQSICKIATGFSEEDLKQHKEFFEAHKVDTPPSYYKFSDVPNIRPDVWFKPVQVWEVKAADLSISPVHLAGQGLVDLSKGISLRFPRFIRIRDDKSPEQATTGEQVATMYRAQNLNTASGPMEEDY